MKHKLTKQVFSKQSFSKQVLRKAITISMVCIFSCITFIGLPSAASERVEYDITKQISRIDSYLQNSVNSGFSGAMLIAKGNTVLLNKGYGFADKENKVANTPNTVFDIGSVTKQFTATAILKLVELQKLKLTDPLTHYFTDLPNDKKHITIHQLLTHTAGFIDLIGNDDFDHLTTNNYFSTLFSTPLLFKPGTSYEYSNAGYSVLARIIELASGNQYEDFVYRTLLKPAGMEYTGYLRPKWEELSLANGYGSNVVNVGSMTTRYNSDGKIAWTLKGNGGFNSTQEDMYKWFIALRNNLILPKELMTKLTTPYVKEYDEGNSYYAYGWATLTTKRKTELVTHNGSNGIFYHDFMWLVEEDIVIIYSTNALTPEVDGIARQVKRMLFDNAYHPRPRKTDILSDVVRASLDNAEDNAQLVEALTDRFSDKVKDAYSLNDAAFMLLNNNHTDEAIALLTFSTQLFPKDGNTWDSLGEAYLKNKSLSQAKQCFEQAIALKTERGCHWCENSKHKINQINQINQP